VAAESSLKGHAVKFRRAGTGEVKTLALERTTVVALTNVNDWYDTYAPGSDDKLLEVVEATPKELSALRRAGFNIRRAPDNAARRRRAKRARAVATHRAAVAPVTGTAAPNEHQRAA
jgi:hypothetical protein